MHLVYFIFIEFVVLPDNKNKCLDTGCVVNLEDDGKELWTDVTIKLKWGHLVSFIALTYSMGSKFRGNKIKSAVSFVAIIPFSYLYPITRMLYHFKT